LKYREIETWYARADCCSSLNKMFFLDSILRTSIEHRRRVRVFLQIELNKKLHNKFSIFKFDYTQLSGILLPFFMSRSFISSFIDLAACLEDIVELMRWNACQKRWFCSLVLCFSCSHMCDGWMLKLMSNDDDHEA
jgi:hypothetical protein